MIDLNDPARWKGFGTLSASGKLYDGLTPLRIK